MVLWWRTADKNRKMGGHFNGGLAWSSRSWRNSEEEGNVKGNLGQRKCRQSLLLLLAFRWKQSIEGYCLLKNEKKNDGGFCFARKCSGEGGGIWKK